MRRTVRKTLSGIRGSRGFTLTEVIIAMFILSVVAIALNTALLSFIKSNSSSRDIAKATAHGNQVLERLRMKKFDDIVFGSDTAEKKYFRNWVVNSATAEKKTVTVQVSWPLTSASHSIKLSTIISRR